MDLIENIEKYDVKLKKDSLDEFESESLDPRIQVDFRFNEFSLKNRAVFYDLKL